MAKVVTDFYKKGDVLYALRDGEKATFSREAEHDTGIILGMNKQRTVVLLTILDISGLSVHDWEEHPDKSQIPEDLAEAVAAWLREHASEEN